MPNAWLSFAKTAPTSIPSASDEWTLVGEWGLHDDEPLRKAVTRGAAPGRLAFYLSLDPERDWVATFLGNNPDAGRGVSLAVDPGLFWLALDKFHPSVGGGPFYVVSANRARFGTVAARLPEVHPGLARTVVNVGVQLPSKQGRHFRPLVGD